MVADWMVTVLILTFIVTARHNQANPQFYIVGRLRLWLSLTLMVTRRMLAALQVHSGHNKCRDLEIIGYKR